MIFTELFGYIYNGIVTTGKHLPDEDTCVRAPFAYVFLNQYQLDKSDCQFALEVHIFSCQSALHATLLQQSHLICRYCVRTQAIDKSR